jgi:RsiW-degrading membrane proteinase PrsW (M82 family)
VSEALAVRLPADRWCVITRRDSHRSALVLWACTIALIVLTFALEGNPCEDGPFFMLTLLSGLFATNATAFSLSGNPWKVAVLAVVAGVLVFGVLVVIGFAHWVSRCTA